MLKADAAMVLAASRQLKAVRGWSYTDASTIHIPRFDSVNNRLDAPDA